VGRKWWALVVGAVLIGAVAIGLAFSSGDVATRTQKFRQVERGMAHQDVRRLFGPPEATDLRAVRDQVSQCWYYAGGVEGGYEFCFYHGRLNSKRRVV
jgi:hypothetical protein